MRAELRARLADAATEAATTRPADAGSAASAGTPEFRRRLFLRYAAAFGVTLVVLAGGFVARGALDQAQQPAVLDRIVVTPDPLVLVVETTAGAHAQGWSSDGRSVPVSGVVWASGDQAVAVVDPNGVVHATGIGSTVVTASVGAVRGSTHVDVVRTLPTPSPTPSPTPTQTTRTATPTPTPTTPSPTPTTPSPTPTTPRRRRPLRRRRRPNPRR